MSNRYSAIGRDLSEMRLQDAIINGAYEGDKTNAGIKETPIAGPTAPIGFNKYI